jgi:hypothetical protein
MKYDSKNMSRGWGRNAIVAVILSFTAGGCADYISTNNAGLESTKIIKNLRRVETAVEPNVPLPYFFKTPPDILEQTVGGNVEYKLFYFCQHHTSPELRELVNTAFASELFDQKGNSTRKADYNVHANAATNQLIVRCPGREDTESVLDFLRRVDVPPVQVKIKCIVSEVYADKTLDWETTLAIEDLLGEGIGAVPAGQAFGSAVQQLVTEPATPAAFPGASLRELAREKMGLKVGYVRSSEKFTAMVDTLESEGYLKVLMNPTVEVVNGKQAKILSSQKVPLQETYLTGGIGGQWTERRTEYEDVVDSLTITPHVFGDGYIGLETSILLGSKLTPEGVKQVPIITKKQIDNKENRIRPGQSLVIGGLRKVERRDVFRGIPGLKDIPLLGILFSGRDFEERAVETVFILTPTISTGGIPYKEMMEEVKRQQGEPTGDDEEGLDPFGKKAREKEKDQILEDAEEACLEAEAEKAIARNAAREAEYRIERAESEAALAKTRSARNVAKAQQMIEEAAKAKAEFEAKSKAADAAQAQAAEIVADATKTKAEVVKAKADADALADAATKAEADAKIKVAEDAKAAADRAVAEAEKIIGGSSSGTGEEGDGAAKAEEPAPDGEKPIDEAPKTDPNRLVPAKGDEAGGAVVAKDKPEATPKSTPLDAPKANDAIAKPASDENKSMLEGGGDGALEKPTARQVNESPKLRLRARLPMLRRQLPMKFSIYAGEAKVCEAVSSTEKGETKIGKADASKPEFVSKQGQGQAEKAKPVAEDPRMRLLMLVLSVLSL